MKTTTQKVEEMNRKNFPVKLEKRSGKNNYEMVINWKNVPKSMLLKRPRSKKQVANLISELEKFIGEK